MMASAALLASDLIASAYASPLAGGPLVAGSPSDRVIASLILLGPYLGAVIGGGIAWWFNRSNAVLALLLLGLTALVPALPQQPDTTGGALAILLPANLLLLALLPHRGLLTYPGIALQTAIGLQIFAVVTAGLAAPSLLYRMVQVSCLPGFISPMGELPDPAALLTLVAIPVLWLRRNSGPDRLRRGYAAALVAAAAAAAFSDEGVWRPILLTLAEAVLILAILQETYALAYNDGLTGLPSRRALTARLAALDGPFTIAMVDVDHFKQFNDRHGHDVGDQVLRMVASTLARTGGGATAYRYGGEEFSVVFPDLSLADAWPHLETLRSRIEETAFHIRGKGRPDDKPKPPSRNRPRPPERQASHTEAVTVTVSIGVAQRTAQRRDPSAVLQAADGALYRAKHAGRNQVSK
jgi:GGDEF domain-containing protein